MDSEINYLLIIKDHMALNEQQKATIESIIKLEFPDKNVSLTRVQLENEIQDFTKVFESPETANGGFATVRKLNNDPAIVFERIELTKNMKITLGDIREYMVTYAKERFLKLIPGGSKTKLSVLGWDSTKLKSVIRERTGYNVRLQPLSHLQEKVKERFHLNYTQAMLASNFHMTLLGLGVPIRTGILENRAIDAHYFNLVSLLICPPDNTEQCFSGELAYNTIQTLNPTQILFLSSKNAIEMMRKYILEGATALQALRETQARTV